MQHAHTAEGIDRRYLRSLARAAAGAIVFGFPLLMTMEMWWLGFYIDRLRLLLFMIVNLLFLVPLVHFVGFERTGSWAEDALDAVVAFGIGAITSVVLLGLFGLLEPGMPVSEIAGKVAVQTVPASFGAALARGQFGSGQQETQEKEQRAGYLGQLFIMAAGALFLTFNVAPTEEMILIGFKMTPLLSMGLVLLSIALLHAFVYAVGFTGQEEMPEGIGPMGGVISYSVAGYGVAVLISVYVLWTFGRTDGASLGQIAMMTSVLGFPAALGAASARLII